MRQALQTLENLTLFMSPKKVCEKIATCYLIRKQKQRNMTFFKKIRPKTNLESSKEYIYAIESFFSFLVLIRDPLG